MMKSDCLLFQMLLILPWGIQIKLQKRAKWMVVTVHMNDPSPKPEKKCKHLMHHLRLKLQSRLQYLLQPSVALDWILSKAQTTSELQTEYRWRKNRLRQIDLSQAVIRRSPELWSPSCGTWCGSAAFRSTWTFWWSPEIPIILLCYTSSEGYCT